jgi:hypothetical protein
MSHIFAVRMSSSKVSFEIGECKCYWYYRTQSMLPQCGLFDIYIYIYIYMIFSPFIFIYWNFSCLHNCGIRDEHDVIIWCFNTKVPGAYLSNLSFLNTMCSIIVWDFWSSKWHCDGIFFDYAVFPCSVFCRCFIFIYSLTIRAVSYENNNLCNWQCRSLKPPLSLSLCIII